MIKRNPTLEVAFIISCGLLVGTFLIANITDYLQSKYPKKLISNDQCINRSK